MFVIIKIITSILLLNVEANIEILFQKEQMENAKNP